MCKGNLVSPWTTSWEPKVWVQPEGAWPCILPREIQRNANGGNNKMSLSTLSFDQAFLCFAYGLGAWITFTQPVIPCGTGCILWTAVWKCCRTDVFDRWNFLDILTGCAFLAAWPAVQILLCFGVSFSFFVFDYVNRLCSWRFRIWTDRCPSNFAK